MNCLPFQMFISLLAKRTEESQVLVQLSLLGANLSFPSPQFSLLSISDLALGDVFFIIWLNCAWCAIRMEISPARDGKYFMRVIWAERFFFLSGDYKRALFFPAMCWLSSSEEADRQPLRSPRLGGVWGRHPLPLTLMGIAFWHSTLGTSTLAVFHVWY